MFEAIGISLSGLDAARTRVGAAATNIANARSVAARDADDPNGFRPVEVAQTSQAQGGTRAEVRAVDPPSVPSFEPDNPDADADGNVARANVSLTGEMVEMMGAEHAFKASLRALETADAMLGSLIDTET